jgi:hypothetical protein
MCRRSWRFDKIDSVTVPAPDVGEELKEHTNLLRGRGDGET